MLHRSPRHRRHNLDRIPGVLENVIAEGHQAIETWATTRPEGDQMVARRRRELREAADKFRDQPPDEVMEQVRSPWPFERELELLKRKTWRLLIASGTESFVTSDSPAVFFEGIGLGNLDSELTFPLSPSTAFVADHKGEQSATPVFIVKPRFVREVNRRVIADAERFIFASTPQPWVSKVAHKVRPYLSRIQWS